MRRRIAFIPAGLARDYDARVNRASSAIDFVMVVGEADPLLVTPKAFGVALQLT